MKKINYLLLLLLCAFTCACGGDDDNSSNNGGQKPTPDKESKLTSYQQKGKDLADALWATSPLQAQPLNDARQTVFDQIQAYADNCTATYFSEYLKSNDQSAESKEKYDVLLYYYRLSIDRIIESLKNDKVEGGTTVIYMLYNMGYVVRTPSSCFGIDIMHRYGKELAPYLDFLCLTHNHQDHYCTELTQAMLDAGKPVLSNYVAGGGSYTSTTPATYTFNNVTVKTSITDHNNSGLSNFVTVFCFNCGTDGGNMTLMHTGDSNYKAAQFTNIYNRVNVLIPRYAPNALTENNIIGTGTGQTTPDYVLLSHILELTHASVAESRWSLSLALERAAAINCEKTYVPMWGEKLTWKNGKLN